MSEREVHYIGVRHHSPGCARSVERALAQITPDLILIEGPPEANERLYEANHPELKPPIALMVAPRDERYARRSNPLAEYSPEWVALRYATSRFVKVEFIDAPIGVQMGISTHAEYTSEANRDVDSPAKLHAEDEAEDQIERASNEVVDQVSAVEVERDPNIAHDPLLDLPVELQERVKNAREIIFDPLAYLARSEGVDDPYTWWERLVERPVRDDIRAFEILETRLSGLRAEVEGLHQELEARGVDAVVLQSPHERAREIRREAYMRCRIHEARKHARSIVVICGAWHVSALRAPHSIGRDRALIRGFKRIPAHVSWVPWSNQLMTSDQYRAGVETPSWYQLLWRHGEDPELVERALCEGASGLRSAGAVIPSASVMDAVHLTRALCALRERPWVELRDVCDAASVTLCRGEYELTRRLERHLSVGDDYGVVPPSLMSVALVRAFETRRRSLRIKIKPHEVETLCLNVIQPRALAKSVFLRRAQLLELSVMFNQTGLESETHLIERWEIKWTPRDDITLSHHGYRGDTVEVAAAHRLSELIEGATSSQMLVNLATIGVCAALPAPVERALTLARTRVTDDSQAGTLLVSLITLVGLLGQRVARLEDIVCLKPLVIDLCVELIGALSEALARCPVSLKASERGGIASALYEAHNTITCWGDTGLIERWERALLCVIREERSPLVVEGRALRCAANRPESLGREARLALESRLNNPTLKLVDLEQLFIGLVANDPRSLEADSALLSTLDRWIAALAEDRFMECLPMLRRGFAGCESRANEALGDQLLELWSIVGHEGAHERGRASLTQRLWDTDGEARGHKAGLFALTRDLFLTRDDYVRSHTLVRSLRDQSEHTSGESATTCQEQSEPSLSVRRASVPRPIQDTLSEAHIKERARRWRLILGSGRALKRRAQLGLHSGAPRTWTPMDTLIERSLDRIYGCGEAALGLISKDRGGEAGLKALDALRIIEECLSTEVSEVVSAEVSRGLDPRALLRVAREGREVQLSWPLLEQLVSQSERLSDTERAQARALVKPLLDDLQDVFKRRIASRFEGELSPESAPSPTARVPWSEVNWSRTITANLKHYQRDLGMIIPERIIRKKRTLMRDADLIICVDQSGSMASSVIYSSVYAAALASLRGVNTRIVLFNHEVTDVSASHVEPVDLIFSTRPHGGTDVLPALRYCASLITRPEKTTLIFISDLLDDTSLHDLTEAAQGILTGGAQLLFLLALSNHGAPLFSNESARALQHIGAPALYSTPDRFPDLLRDVLDRRMISSHAG